MLFAERSGPKAIVLACCLSLPGCSKHAPSSEQVQSAVNQVVDWTRMAGTVQVIGVQENPTANEALVDVRFNGFQYKANFLGIPLPKTAQQPRQPDVKSPTFYQEMATWPSRQVFPASYTGGGRATIKRYNDGRWMLTSVEFNFQQLNANLPIVQ